MRTLQSELVKKGLYKNKDNKTSRNKTNKPKRTNEKLSRRDLEELMGSRRPKYKRSRGAFRQL